MREHLGLLYSDDPSGYDKNSEMLPEGNDYDWGTPEDELVQDPLSDQLWKVIHETSKTNTGAFRNVFQCLPDDAGML